MDWLGGWVRRHRLLIGVVLIALGILMSVILAFSAASKSPPDGAQSALLVIIGGLFNLGGVWAVSRRPGAPSLTGSRIVIRHLAQIATDVKQLANLAGDAFDRRPAGKGREDIGRLSWGISDVQSRLITNLEDWTRVYPDLIEDAPRKTMSVEPEGR